ncbi:hypothetical protein Angca_008628, partial [Angiostrongylus cantonensis]
MFLSDDHSIVLDKFTHTPQKIGCTAMMIGPARKEDGKREVSEGLLLAYTQPNFSWEEAQRFRRRTKRWNSLKWVNSATPISRQHIKDGVLFLTTSSTEHHPSREQLEATSMHVPVESYEVFEYLEGAEEAEESDENVDVLMLTHKSSTGHRRPLSTRTTSSGPFPTLLTESSTLFTAPATPVIIFQKAERLRLRNVKRPQPELSLHPYSTINDADASISEDHWNSPFSLPPARDEQVAFLLTNGARLTDYKWIGLYDQCKNKSIPLVSLEDVDPPREEEIGRIKGLERNISSGIVRILNCNTILVPNLYLDVDLKFPHTFFFVGVGNLTNIVQQVKSRAIGYERNDPLEKHRGDALMIRLPRRIRTFDVDFLSIYNEDEKKVYGYMDLPSVLVPPCAD